MVANESEGEQRKEAPPWLVGNITEASKNARKIYFLYIGFLAYCALTVVSTTDRQIILNETARLPIVNLDVSLNGFFILAPLLAIFVFVYLQLYLQRLSGLISDLRTRYAPVEKRRLYPWMMNIAEDPEPGRTGKLPGVLLGLSLWWSLPVVLILFAVWFVKKHDPFWSYVVGLFPMVGTSVILCFWCYGKRSSLLELIRKDLGKTVLAFTVLIFEIFLLCLVIPRASRGDIEELGVRWSWTCVNLSNEKLITEQNIEYEGIYWVDLRGVRLEGANLTSAVLERADLREAHLEHARLVSAILNDANLGGADLREASLSGADLQQADLGSADLQQCDLTSAELQRANLRAADLQQAQLSLAKLHRADLTSADLKGADLRGSEGLAVDTVRQAINWMFAFYDREFLDTLGFPPDHNDRVVENNLSEYDLAAANLNKANLRRVNLRGAYLMGADLQEANLSEADLRRTDLTAAHLQRSDLRGAQLQGVRFFGADLQKAKFGEEANLLGADLRNANLEGTVLQGANLVRAKLSGANLQEADLQGANLQWADLRGARNLAVAQLSEAKTLYGAELDSTLMEQIKKDYPHLLQDPKGDE